ncbi:hypothetical protein BaRGS_00013961, partial [Batillaria attramentaria]
KSYNGGHVNGLAKIVWNDIDQEPKAVGPLVLGGDAMPLTEVVLINSRPAPLVSIARASRVPSPLTNPLYQAASRCRDKRRDRTD